MDCKLNNISNKIALNYCALKQSTVLDWETKSTIIEYKKGDQIVKEGQQRHKLFFLIKGSLKAYYILNDKKITDWFAFENQFITSSSSYLSDEPSLHFIETIEDCVILETEKSNVELLCKKHHDFEHLFRVVLSKVIVQFRYRIASIQFKTVKQRYESLIEQYPQIELTVPLGDIASYLGITQETLSRIRASN
ncbi:Crp/Fnr family transcriptional regulator [Aquimarina sp. AD10]|nr:Crp/Fnr family transcriptional regulator [Aquimarina sp. AD10]RKM95561.1 Crp/Fnr family transcriptional regulator [Aquimarina sp. AD10]